MNEHDRPAVAIEYASECAEAPLFEKLLWKVALWAPFGMRVIWDDTQKSPYLLRVYLTPDWKGTLRLPRLYLHHFFRSDGDREVHNHPWGKSVSLVLTRGYREFRWDPVAQIMEERVVRPWRLNRIGRNDFHRVELHKGRPWTLFLTGRRVEAAKGEDWGFLNTDNGEYTPWGEWHAK